MSAAHRLVVVGGGISGLSAAWAAREQLGEGLDVVVLEASEHTGGKAQSSVEDGFLLESGPHGFLDPDPALRSLAAATGIEHELIPANVAARRRFVLRGGELCELRPTPRALVRLLGVRGLLRLLCEPLVPRAEGAFTVWDFAARRLGCRAADRLAVPMVAGVFAGDARSLELASAFPELHRLAAGGSLARGLWRARGRGRGDRRGGQPRRTLATFRRGLGSLPQALASLPGIDVRRGVTVENLQLREPNATVRRFLVETRSGPLDADAVVVATEAPVAARLLARCAPTLTEELAAVQTADIAVVALGYPPGSARRVPLGYGALAAPDASANGVRPRLLGALWEHHVFPDRAPEGAALVRAFYGGALDPQVLDLDDAALVALAVEEQRRILSLEDEPLLARVFRHRSAIPQYGLGHARRVELIQKEVASIPGLFLAGTMLTGPGFGRAAANGIEAGRRVGSGTFS